VGTVAESLWCVLNMRVEVSKTRIELIPESDEDLSLLSTIFSESTSWCLGDGVPFNLWVTYDAGESGRDMALILTPKRV